MPTLADYKAPYPAPTADQKRYVIYLEPKEDEDHNYKVQLIPGRVEMVDGANLHMLGAKIEEKTVDGWGFPYHVVSLSPHMAATLMMPLGDAAVKRPKFVGNHNQPLIRYNSKLPIVVYMPKDGVLRYKIWSASGDGKSKKEGLEAKEE